MMDQEMFNGWKDHPVTKAVFKRLEQIQEDIRNEMLDSHTIMRQQSDKHLAFLAGERESIELIFNLSIEDIQDEKCESSRI